MTKRKMNFLRFSIITTGLIILLLSVFWLPSISEDAAKLYPEYSYLRYPVLIGIYITTVPFYYALYETLKLLEFIEDKNAFSVSAANSLRLIKYCAAIVAVIYGIGIIYLILKNALHPGVGIIGVVILLASSAISIFSDVLRELLINALNMKYENDLTI